MALDLARVRQQFPALAGDWAFFDNAGGSQILKTVVDRTSDFLLTSNVQLGASYETSRRATERVDEARRRFAHYVNAARPEEIVMGPSTTELLRRLAEAMRPGLQPGDEIIVTNCDHEANIGCWARLASAGVVVKWWRLNPETFRLDLADLEPLLTDRTRLVCMTHASNILGTINDVAAIARLVHGRGAKLCVDAVAYAPHRLVDVRAWDVDFYVFSLYKVYGPHYAILYGKYDHLRQLASINHFFFGEEKVPGKLEPGGVTYELAHGATALVDYLEELGGRGDGALGRAFHDIAEHESVLAEELLAYLRGKNHVRIIGERTVTPETRVPTISFVVEGRDSAEIVERVDPHQVAIRFGDFYARRLIDDLGLSPCNGVVRVSMVHYNTPGEVDRLISALDGVL